MDIQQAIKTLTEIEERLRHTPATYFDGGDVDDVHRIVAMLKCMAPSSSTSERKRLTPQEFREQGYLRELNRQFLHPLGMALEVIGPTEEEVAGGNDFPEFFGGVWDYREDPEGMAFDESMLATPQALEQARAVRALRAAKVATRLAKLGFDVQPVPGLEE